MSFLYLNSGYAELFSNNTFSCINSFVYNQNNGVVVYNGYGMIPLENIPSAIYGKFDFHVSSLSLLDISIGYGSSNLLDGLILSLDKDCIKYKYDSEIDRTVSIDYNSDLVYINALNSLWFCIIPSDDEFVGSVSVKLNQNNIVNDSFDFSINHKKVEIMSNNDVYLSNFILSDNIIQPDYTIVSPNVSAISNIDFHNDSYVFTENNQELILSVNADELISKYGNDIEVVGFVSAGMSAYSTLNNVGKFCSLEKENSNYAIKKEFILSNNASDYIYDFKFLSNIKLINMNNKILGWLAKV